MRRYAIIDPTDNRIINVVEYATTPTTPPPGFLVGIVAVQHDAVGCDWTWNGSALVPPPPRVIAPVVPETISDRQFFQGLAIQGVITQQEALAAVQTGTVPGNLAAIVAQMPAPQQFSANMILCGATVFERRHPMTVAIGTAYGWTEQQIDAFFVAAAAL